MKHYPPTLSRTLDLIERRRLYTLHMMNLNPLHGGTDNSPLDTAPAVAYRNEKKKYYRELEVKLRDEEYARLQRLQREGLSVRNKTRRSPRTYKFGSSLYNTTNIFGDMESNDDGTDSKEGAKTDLGSTQGSVNNNNNNSFEENDLNETADQILERLGLESGMRVLDRSLSPRSSFAPTRKNKLIIYPSSDSKRSIKNSSGMNYVNNQTQTPKRRRKIKPHPPEEEINKEASPRNSRASSHKDDQSDDFEKEDDFEHEENENSIKSKNVNEDDTEEDEEQDSNKEDEDSNQIKDENHKEEEDQSKKENHTEEDQSKKGDHAEEEQRSEEIQPKEEEEHKSDTNKEIDEHPKEEEHKSDTNKEIDEHPKEEEHSSDKPVVEQPKEEEHNSNESQEIIEHPKEEEDHDSNKNNDTEELPKQDNQPLREVTDDEENKAAILAKMEKDKLNDRYNDSNNFSSSVVEPEQIEKHEEEKHEEEKHEEEKLEEEKHEEEEKNKEEEEHEEEKHEEEKHEETKQEEESDKELHSAQHSEVFKNHRSEEEHHSEELKEVSDKESEKEDDNILKSVFDKQEEIINDMADELKRLEREEYLNREREGEDLLHRIQYDDSDALRDMSDARKMESDLAKEESDARKLESDSNFFNTAGLIGSQLFD